jgi:protein-S-isoprenylcysteine O-methyltransferase Ste14
MKTRPQTNWLIDAVLFLGLFAAFFPDVTGVETHQWIGIFGGALAVLHLALHWEWVGAVTRRFFGRTSNSSRLYLLIDGGIMLGFLAMVGTGLIISTWMSLNLSNYAAWHALHVVSSLGTLLMVVIKIGLHWRWIAAIGRKVLEPEPTPSRPAVPIPRGAVSRREFLGVMGVAGVAATVALTSGASGLLSLLVSEAEASPEGSPGASSASAEESAASGTDANASSSTDSSTASSSLARPTQSVASLPQSSAPTESAASAACSVACSHGCSFPGSCRRYTDSNGNGLCDWGECM